MTHQELTLKYQRILSDRKNLVKEEFSYITTALKNNEGSVRNYTGTESFVLDMYGVKMTIQEVYMADDGNIMLVLQKNGNDTCQFMKLDSDNPSQIQVVAAFVDTNIRAKAEHNCYDLMVFYSQDNSRRINPGVLAGLDDVQIWDKITRLGRQDYHVFQLNGPARKFKPFDQFVAEMNDHGFFSHYVVRLTLKEKYL